MRIVFMGTGEIALPTLEWLVKYQELHQYEIVGVYTQPDKPVGRKQIMTPPEVKVIASEAGIPVFQPETLRRNEEARSEYDSLNPDLTVVMAYGQILPLAVIERPTIACVNLHASLLPRHRGASPIQAAIRDGDSETGITLMHIVPKLDAGDMILKSSIQMNPGETGGSLHDRLAHLGPALMAEGLPKMLTGEFESLPQEEEKVTYSGKLGREDGHLDWSMDAEDLERLIRAYDPWPGTFALIDTADGPKKLKIFPQTSVGDPMERPPGSIAKTDSSIAISCGQGSLILEGDVQVEGKKRIAVGDWLRGTQIPEKAILQ